MGNIYELYYFYPTCIASGFIYELNYLYPAPSASGKHLLLSLVYTVSLNLATCFLSLEIFFTISWLIICRNSVVKYKFKPLKLLENALFSAFYLSKLFIVGISFNVCLSLCVFYRNHNKIKACRLFYIDFAFVLFCLLFLIHGKNYGKKKPLKHFCLNGLSCLLSNFNFAL